MFSGTSLFLTFCYFFIKEIHAEQKKRRLENEYPHRISRKGYANLEEELISDLISKSVLSEKEEEPDLEIDRSTTWLEARKDKDGQLVREELKIIAANIVSYSFVI